MHTCVILKPSEVTNMTYFFVLGGHYPLFWKSMLMRKKKMFVVISSLKHFTI